MIAEAPNIEVESLLRDPRGKYWTVVGVDEIGGLKAKGPQAMIVKGTKPTGHAVRVPLAKLKEWEVVR
jgi:hypothetical protein